MFIRISTSFIHF